MAKIREMASSVLRQYFPWPLPSGLLHSMDQLLDTALVHCNSARPRQCDTGALLCVVMSARSVCLPTLCLLTY